MDPEGYLTSILECVAVQAVYCLVRPGSAKRLRNLEKELDRARAA